MEINQRKDPKPVPLTSIEAIDPDAFDWSAFCSSYKGRALITRLLFVAELILHEPLKATPRSLAIARAAAAQAIPLLRATWDVENYYRAVNLIFVCIQRGGAEPMDVDLPQGANTSVEAKTGKPDQAWIAQTTKEDQAENSRLGVELNGYMSNLIKESIRLTYLAMAQLALKEGSLPNSLKSFQHVREYSSGPAHAVELGLAIINASLSFNETAPLAGNIPKVEAMVERLHPVAASAPISSTMTIAQVNQAKALDARNLAARRAVGVKLRVARGLSALAHHDYARCAQEFSQIGEEGGLGEWEGEVMSTTDVAFVWAICTLATKPRDHVRRALLERTSFHSDLGDHQRWVLELVRAFVDARYGEALTLLRHAEPFMTLNPFLSPHTPDLLSQIRARAISQYLKPFTHVRVSAMAAAFGADEQAMLAEVCELAEAGRIPVKVDLVANVLAIQDNDPRAHAFKEALEKGEAITNNALGNTFRMRLKEADVCVHAGPRDKRRQQLTDWHSLKAK